MQHTSCGGIDNTEDLYLRHYCYIVDSVITDSPILIKYCAKAEITLLSWLDSHFDRKTTTAELV